MFLIGPRILFPISFLLVAGGNGSLSRVSTAPWQWHAHYVAPHTSSGSVAKLAEANLNFECHFECDLTQVLPSLSKRHLWPLYQMNAWDKSKAFRKPGQLRVATYRISEQCFGFNFAYVRSANRMCDVFVNCSWQWQQSPIVTTRDIPSHPSEEWLPLYHWKHACNKLLQSQARVIVFFFVFPCVFHGHNVLHPKAVISRLFPVP